MQRKSAIATLVFVAALLGSAAGFAATVCPGVTTCPLSSCGPTAIVVTPGMSLQGVINSAPNGAQICVKPGTYVGKIDFKGKGITLVSSGGPAVTILKGSGSPSGPVVTFKTFEAADSVLDGFGVQSGSTTFGGGIYISGASPTIRNCIVSKNTATGDPHSRGGGAFVMGASSRPSITCTQFSGNSASFGGGGLASAYSADPYLRSDLFQGNSAAYGGGIAVHLNGRLDVATTKLAANRATVDGGGIHSGTTYGNVLVRRCWFKNNTAIKNGGGMWVPAGLAEVLNCTFDGNQASVGGGVAAAFGSMVDVASTIFVNNRTLGGGSATLVNDFPSSSNTSVVNHYNDFFGNTGGDYLSTYGNNGLLLVNPLLGTCCPGAGSPAINAGIPDALFNDTNGTANDMGACGGPTP